MRTLKALIYETPVDSDEDLIAKLLVVTTTAHKISGIFKKVCKLLAGCYEACIDVGGKTF